MDDSKDEKIINLDERKFQKLKKMLDSCGLDELDGYESIELIEFLTKELKLVKSCKLSLSNGDSFYIDKNTIKEIEDLQDEIKSRPDYLTKLPSNLKIAQTHQTNTLKGAFPSVAKGQFKDKNYKEYKRTLEAETYYTLEYSTVDGEKKKYKTAIAIKDLPNIKLAMKDVTFYKFFTFVHFQFNTHNTCLFRFDTKLFIEFLGKKPTKKVIEKTNAKLNQYCEHVLPSIRLKWVARGNQSETITPFAMTSVRKSVVKISLEASYADSLKNSFYEAPKEIGLLSENAFLMADYIFTYARQCKKDSFNLTNDTLYKKTTLPTYEEVKDGAYSRNTNKAIKEPYYKALREIQDKLTHKLILQEEDLDCDNWESFKIAKISFQILDYSETVNSMQKAQDKKIKQATKQTTKNKKP